MLTFKGDFGTDTRPARKPDSRKAWAKDSRQGGTDGTRLDQTFVNDLKGLLEHVLATYGVATVDGDDTLLSQAIALAVSGGLAGKVDKAGDTMTGALTLSGAPVDALHAANKAYVDSIAAAGLSLHPSARVASTSNVNIASAPASIDGVTLANGDRVLLKNQTAPAENGIRVFTSAGAALNRATDMDTWAEVPGALVSVTEGTVNSGSVFACSSAAGGTLDTTAITWTVFLSGVSGVASFEGRSGAVTSAAGDYLASEITNTPAGAIAATTVQAALNELDSEKVAIAAIVDNLTSGGSAVPLSAEQGKALKALIDALGGGAAGAAQGRLTLQENTPFMTTTQAAQNIVRWTPYRGRRFPLWNGSSFAMVDYGGELTQATTDTTKSPAAVAANNIYDVFGWDDTGTKRATRGPPWATGGGTDGVRGTGAGSTELELLEGLLVNKHAITNGPAAQRGLYLGSIRSNGSSLIDWIIGGTGAGGVQIVLGVWNMWARGDVDLYSRDDTNSWTYEGDWRSANGSAAMSAAFLLGLPEDSIRAHFKAFSQSPDTTLAIKRACAIGLDSTSAPAAGCVTGFTQIPRMQSTGLFIAVETNADLVANGLQGWRFVQALEKAETPGTAPTWYGDAVGAGGYGQNGLHFSLRC